MNVGVDIIEIYRIKKNLENPRFLNKVFTPSELSWRNNAINREIDGRVAEHFAGIFAAKEAVVKAKGGYLREIEITYKDGKVLAIKDNEEIPVSISHCKEYAVAICIDN